MSDLFKWKLLINVRSRKWDERMVNIDMKLKTGVIGTNFISDEFCDAVSRVPGVVLKAVFSRRQETGDAFAARTLFLKSLQTMRNFSRQTLMPCMSHLRTLSTVSRHSGRWNIISMSSARKSWR